MQVLRTLTIVKDNDGRVKIAQFGSCWVDDEPTCASDQMQFFEDFVSSEEKVTSLKKGIDKIAFFSEQEYIEYSRGLRNGNKRETTYEKEFMDSSVGVYILGKCDKFNSKTRLISYYKYADDALFSSARYIIDFQSNTAKIVTNREEVFSCELPIKVNRTKAKKEEPHAAQEPPKRRGRPKKVEAQKVEVPKVPNEKKTSTRNKRSSDLW